MRVEGVFLPDKQVNHYVVYLVQTPKLRNVSASEFRSVAKIPLIHEDWASSTGQMLSCRGEEAMDGITHRSWSPASSSTKSRSSSWSRDALLRIEYT